MILIPRLTEQSLLMILLFKQTGNEDLHPNNISGSTNPGEERFRCETLREAYNVTAND